MRALEDEYYTCLWHVDYLDKLHKEEQQALEKHARNMETLEVLNKQVASKRAYEEQVQRLLKEEAALLQQQQKQFQLEDLQEKIEKRKKQVELKESLDKTLAMVQARKEKEKLEAEKFDALYRKILEEGAQITPSDKNERLKEALSYLENVKKEKAERNAKENESERLIFEDNERQWRKQMAIREKEAENRRRILRETLEGRNRQIQEKMRENERKQRELKKDVEDIQKMIHFNKYMEKETAERNRAAIQKYKMDIMEQIENQKEQQERKQLEMQEEYETYKRQEEEYQMRLKDSINDPRVGNFHPLRIRSPNISDGRATGETDTMMLMKKRIADLEQLVKQKQKRIDSLKDNNNYYTQSDQRIRQFNNILSYYTED